MSRKLSCAAWRRRYDRRAAFRLWRGEGKAGVALTVSGAVFLLLARSISTGAEVVPPGVATVSGGRVEVKVSLAQRDGSKRPAVDAVAWLPAAAEPDPSRQAGAATIAQRNKAFEPHVEVVSTGTTVVFPNLDRIYHNVFSLSEIARFDLGLYRSGASRSVTFAKPGVIRIYCNIHPAMSAFLVVIEGSAFAKTAADGRALLPAVKPGAYRLSVWHERGGERGLDVVVRPGVVTPVEVSLDASQWRAEPHTNKYGKAYPPPDDEQTRY